MTLLSDLRFALRGWRRSPGFALAAIVTLALGIGANAAVFSVVSGVLLKPLPFGDPGRVVQLSVTSTTDPRLPPTFVTFADLEAWRRQSTTLEQVATYSPYSQNLQQVAVPEQVATVRVDSRFFATLGVQAAIGRVFADGDPPDVVVVSAGFWRRHLNGDPSAVGRTIVLDGESRTVIGVMPADFEFPYRSVRTDLWTAWAPRQAAPNARLDAAIGRLKPGVKVDAAREELTTLSSSLVPGRRANVTAMSEIVSGKMRRSLLVLLGAVGLVLLVACANVANLLLARAAARSREVAVRRALGAGAGRLVRQFLTESLLLSFAGGAVGSLVAAWGTRLLVRMAEQRLPRAWDIGFDWRVFLFLGAACLASGVAFGLAPALAAGCADVQSGLKSGDRGGSSRNRFRDGLVVAEIALAFVLLAGAGLLVRTFLNLQATPTAFNPAGVLTLHVAVADAAEAHAIRDRVAQIPGVRAAGFVSLLPLQSSNWNGRIRIAGRPDEQSAEFRYVSPGYFEAMSIPLRRGRAFTDADTAAAPKALVVNEAFARLFTPGEDPIGREVVDRGTIVGVIADVHQLTLDRPPGAELYYPIAQNFAQLRSVGSSLVVRSAAPMESLVPAIRRAIRDVNPNQAAFRVASMEQVIDDSIGPQKLYAWLLGLFAAIGAGLASAGVYGVMSYVVTLRTRELGVRLALGATGGRVMASILGRGAALAGLGLMLGLGGALALTRVLQGALFGVTPTDPPTFIAIAVLLSVIALCACMLPARRAARVDPVVALRAE